MIRGECPGSLSGFNYGLRLLKDETMKVIKTTVYEFSELSDEAKEKARDWAREFACSDEWWESTYEDAKRIGLGITGFGLDRERGATGEFMVFGGAEQVAGLILSEHGKDCETFKTATAFLADRKKLDAEIAAVDGDDETNADYETWQDKRGEMDEEFLRSLLEDYAIMLEKERDYLMSDEAIDECIAANEYTFTETGKRFG